MKKISLNGKWNMFLESAKRNYTVNVPCSDYGAMLVGGEISDPFYGTNENDCLFVSESDKWFERSFMLEADDLKHDEIILSCKMLDTICEIYLNGILAGEGKNAYVGCKFNVKKFLKEGENEIKIKFASPVNYVKKRQKEAPLPRNANGINGVSYIRKPACHFGWDWGPNVPLSGILGDIELLLSDSEITDFSIRQIHKNGSVTLDITSIGNGKPQGEIITPSGEKIPLRFENGRASAVIENPQLWWTYELSGADVQPLYTVSVGGITKRIGLRTIILDRGEDEYGSNFRFILNGEPIFAKGANLIPQDAIADRITDEKLEKTVNDARLANFNMIRIWGGGYYGSDKFYDLCDEKGILVWQDFMFACLMYPFYEDDFLSCVKEEIEYNVKRISHHASLALWCGNNEIEFMFSYLPEKSEIVKAYRDFFYRILPDELRKYDADTSYIETSPIGKGFRKSITADNWGDTHMWHVWHGGKPLDYYGKRYTRFCSEYGMESLPSLDCSAEFAPPEELGLYSKTMLHHQKCLSGNAKMLFYLLEKFNEPRNYDDLIYLTGITQMECVGSGAEHWRRNKGRCNGAIWWQFNDCWGAPSWSSVDYFEKWKPLMYASAQFNKAFTVSIETGKKTARFYIINDTLNVKECTLEYGAYDFDGNAVIINKKDITVGANSINSELSLELGGLDKTRNVVFARLLCENEQITERTKVLLPERKLKLKKADIKCSVINNEIILESSTYARHIFVDIRGESTPLSENCFDLFPNKIKKIRLTNGAFIDPNFVTVKCVNNVEYAGNDFAGRIFRLKFNLKPENIANRFYYSAT